MLAAVIFEHKTNMILLHILHLIHDMNIGVELGLPNYNNEQAGRQKQLRMELEQEPDPNMLLHSTVGSVLVN